MKKAIIVLGIITLAVLLNSCMIFGGFVSKVNLDIKDDDNTTIREATIENYKVVADVPIATTGEQVRYTIRIFDTTSNEVIANNEILLTINKEYRRKYGRGYNEVVILNSETLESMLKKHIFFYEYVKQGNYQIEFIISSIGGKKLSTPINAITYQKVISN